MAEQVSDDNQVHAVADHLSREGMTQGARAERFASVGECGPLTEVGAGGAVGDPAASVVEEHRGGGRGLGAEDGCSAAPPVAGAARPR